MVIQIDMHLHIEGRSPCSVLKLEELYDTLSPHIGGLCITDHWNIKPIKNLYLPERKVFFGVEVSSDLGDILAYGINMIPSKNLTPRQIIDFIHRQGGIAVCAHPFSSRHSAFGDNVYDYNFDAIEINGAIGNQANNMAKEAARSLHLPTIGGSDAHSKEQLNTIATRFNKQINSILDIIREVKNNNCEVVKI
jgi:predicted metal-dependent phosphoesterase TrpH